MKEIQECGLQELSKAEMCNVNGGVIPALIVWGVIAIGTGCAGFATGYLMCKYL